MKTQKLVLCIFLTIFMILAGSAVVMADINYKYEKFEVFLTDIEITWEFEDYDEISPFMPAPPITNLRILNNYICDNTRLWTFMTRQNRPYVVVEVTGDGSHIARLDGIRNCWQNIENRIGNPVRVWHIEFGFDVPIADGDVRRFELTSRSFNHPWNTMTVSGNLTFRNR